MNTYSTQCPPGITTLLTTIERKAVFKIDASVISVLEDGNLLCRSQTGVDILNQETDHLRHIRPIKLEKSQIRNGLPILLRTYKRAEVVDFDRREVYLYDEGHCETLSDWKHYRLPKTLLDIPAQAFEVHLNQAHDFAAGSEVSLLVSSSDFSTNVARGGRVIYNAAVLTLLK